MKKPRDYRRLVSHFLIVFLVAVEIAVIFKPSVYLDASPPETSRFTVVVRQRVIGAPFKVSPAQLTLAVYEHYADVVSEGCEDPLLLSCRAAPLYSALETKKIALSGNATAYEVLNLTFSTSPPCRFLLPLPLRVCRRSVDGVILVHYMPPRGAGGHRYLQYDVEEEFRNDTNTLILTITVYAKNNGENTSNTLQPYMYLLGTRLWLSG